MHRQKGKVQVIATKVTIETKQKLQMIAQAFGMSLFQLLQAFVLLCVRLCDQPSLLSDEHEKMLTSFLCTIKATRGSFNPILYSGSKSRNVKSALLFVDSPSAMRPQLLRVTDRNGLLCEDYNLDAMLMEFLKASDPLLLEELKREKKKRSQISLFDTLREILMESQQTEEDRIKADIEELFSDIRINTGDMVNEETFYKKKHNRGDYTAITQLPRKRRLAEIR